ncbi:MAG: nucleotide exchange factor GrpE [Gracilimonas sp.]
MSKENISEQEISTNEKFAENDQKEEQVAEVVEEQVETEAQETEEQSEKDEKDLKIEQLENELETAKDGMLRKAAELDNVRKRVQRERVQLFEEAKAGALEDFMPISDDLIRTIKAAEESEIEDSFFEGVKMVADKFKKVLEKHGVERIDETGVPFDVNLHDAMMKQPAPDEETGSDIVLNVMESGYKIGNRTIRHAKVIVSE